MRGTRPLRFVCLICLARSAVGQEMTNFDRQRDRLMLRAVEKDLRQYYYDTTFHGLPLATIFDSAEARIAVAQSNSEAFLTIALTLNALGDFLYFYYALAPRSAVRLRLQSPGDSVRSVIAQAKVTSHFRVMDLTRGDDIWQLIRRAQNVAYAHRGRFVEFGNDVLVLKLPEFAVDDREIDRFVRRAEGFKALVIDLRGDPGGLVSTLQRLAGGLVGADTFGVHRARNKTEPLRTNAGGPRFTGTVVAVVDAQSGSAAEVLAYLLQMRKRGLVVGDRTAGAVMEARAYQHTVGTDVVAFYYMQVTVADLVFADGTRLEGRGVIPNEIVLPSGADLAAGRDPALARAITLAGHAITPDAAGALFPDE